MIPTYTVPCTVSPSIYKDERNSMDTTDTSLRDKLYNENMLLVKRTLADQDGINIKLFIHIHKQDETIERLYAMVEKVAMKEALKKKLKADRGVLEAFYKCVSKIVDLAVIIFHYIKRKMIEFAALSHRQINKCTPIMMTVCKVICLAVIIGGTCYLGIT